MNEVKRQIDNLIELVKKSDIYTSYQYVLRQVEDNNDINTLVEEIRRLQKEAVNQEQSGNLIEVERIDGILERKLSILNSIPLYQEYIKASEEVNDLINIIKNKFQYYIDSLLA